MVRVLEKMMSKRAEDRYQTPAEVAEALEEWTQQPIEPPPDEEMPQLSRAAMSACRGDGPRTPSPSSVRMARTVPPLRPPSTRIGPGDSTPQPGGSLTLPANGSGRAPAPAGDPSPTRAVPRQPAATPPKSDRSDPRSGFRRRHAANRRRYIIRRRQQRFLAIAAAVTLGALLLIGGVCWLLFHSGSNDTHASAPAAVLATCPSGPVAPPG
jgi:hypothetical protein